MNHTLIDEKDIEALKAKVLGSGLTVSQVVSTTWASASTFRGSDKRGAPMVPAFVLLRKKNGLLTILVS